MPNQARTSRRTGHRHHGRDEPNRARHWTHRGQTRRQADACVLHAAAHPQRDVHAGGASRGMAWFGPSAPRVYDSITSRLDVKAQLRSEPRRVGDSLYESGTGLSARSGRLGRVAKAASTPMQIRVPPVRARRSWASRVCCWSRPRDAMYARHRGVGSPASCAEACMVHTGREQTLGES